MHVRVLQRVRQKTPHGLWPAVCVSFSTSRDQVKGHARAVKSVPIKVITIGKGDSPGTAAVAEEWAAKIQRYAKYEGTNIKPNPTRAAQPEVAVKAEGDRILKYLSSQDRVIILDERGRKVTSVDMAAMIAEAGDRNASSLVFCIGGPHGHGAAVRARGDDVISLSPLVLNHQIAQLVLLEQVYRAWTILRGEPYHH